MMKTDLLTKGRQLRLKTQERLRRKPQWEDPDPDAADDEVQEEPRFDSALNGSALTDYSERLHERRRALLRRTVINLFIFVMLPTLVAAIYYAAFATPRYVSEARLTIQAEDRAVTSLLGTMLGTGSGSVTKEIYVLQNYVTSPEVLSTLEKWLGMRAHYSNPEVDWWSRLPKDATKEEFEDYYSGLVEAEITIEGEILTLRVEAFEPGFATRLANSLVTMSENLLNKIAERAREDAVSFARGELAAAEVRLREVRMKLLEFRNRRGELDPRKDAATITTIVSGMERQLAETRAELAQVSSFMRSDSARIVELKTRIKTLEHQITAERLRLAAPEEGSGNKQPLSMSNKNTIYSEVLNAYENLLIEEEFANRAYEAAFTAVEVARADAARQHSYVVDFVSPELPQEAIRPERLVNTLTVFMILLIGYLIVGFLIGAIREHAKL